MTPAQTNVAIKRGPAVNGTNNIRRHVAIKPISKTVFGPHASDNLPPITPPTRPPAKKRVSIAPATLTETLCSSVRKRGIKVLLPPAINPKKPLVT
ncbi:hypothetical protein ES703_79481 [subsurface metagenome]